MERGAWQATVHATGTQSQTVWTLYIIITSSICIFETFKLKDNFFFDFLLLIYVSESIYFIIGQNYCPQSWCGRCFWTINDAIFEASVPGFCALVFVIWCSGKNFQESPKQAVLVNSGTLVHTRHSELLLIDVLTILAWKITWTEEPGWLQSMGLQRVSHDWAASLLLFHFHQ